MISINGVTKKYTSKKNEIIALDNICFDYSCSFGMIFITGKSGSGKTTLLRILGGIDQEFFGEIRINNVNIYDATELDLLKYRRNVVSFIFQNFNLINELDIETNILINNPEDSIQFNENLKSQAKNLGVMHLMKKYPNQISGGERQRIAILRAIAQQKSIIFADEPTGNLDYINEKIVFDELKKISSHAIVVVCSHNIKAANDYADIIINLEYGKIKSKKLNYKNSYLNNEKYIITEKNHQESISLSKDQLLELFIERIKPKRGSIVFEYEKAIDNSFKEKTEQNKNITNSEEKTQSSCRLSSNVKRAISSRYILNNKSRMLFLVLIQTFVLILLSISSIFAFHNPKIVLSQIVINEDIADLEISKHVFYEDDFLNERSKFIKSGNLIDSFLSDLEQQYPIAYNVGTYSISNSNDTEFNISIQSQLFVGDIQELQYLDDVVPLSVSSEESTAILVTSDLFYNLFGGLSLEETYTIYLAGNIYEIQGILDIDQEENSIIQNCIFIDNSTFSRDFIRKIDFPNIFFSRIEQQFIDLISIGYINDNEIDLLYGNLPIEDNEILVSQQFLFNQFGLVTQDYVINEILGHEYRVFDNWNEKYNHYYSDYLNYSEFFSDGLTVSGVYTTNENYSGDYVYDIVISQENIQELQKAYENTYESVVIFLGDEISTFVNAYIENDIYGVQENLSDLYQFEHKLDSYNEIVTGAIIFMLLFSFIYISFMSKISINSRKKDIAIMISLGISKKDIYFIYIIENMIVGIFCVFLSIIFYLYSIEYLNNFIQISSLNYKVFSASIYSIILIIFVSFAYTLFSSTTTLRRLYRSNLIEFLNE